MLYERQRFTYEYESSCHSWQTTRWPPTQHVSMKVTNLQQIARGIAVREQVEETRHELEGVKHRLWVHRALTAIAALLEQCEFASVVDDAFCRLHGKLSDFRNYIRKNRASTHATLTVNNSRSISPSPLPSRL